jgi:hypothetical protein
MFQPAVTNSAKPSGGMAMALQRMFAAEYGSS